MMKKNIFFNLFIAFSLFFTGCDDTDLTPAYIVIDEEALINCMDVSKFNEEAIGHPMIYDTYYLDALKPQYFPALWVAINNGTTEDERGVWELPCKIPVLAEGPVMVKFTPAYYRNGKSNILPGYKVVIPLEKKVTLKRGSETHFTKDDLIFKYNPRVLFPLLVPFEQSSTTFTQREGKGANILPLNGVGVIELKDTIADFDIITSDILITYKDKNIKYTVLELEYKIEYTALKTPSILPEFGVEVRYTNQSTQKKVVDPLVNFKYNKEWRKVYVDLSDIIGKGGNGGALPDLKIGLTGFMPEEGAYSNIKFFFDNIKISTY